MKRRRLTREQGKRMVFKREKTSQELAAEMYDYSTFLAEDFDAARQSGAVLEVKSTVARMQNGARGRFRLFKPQHEQLVRRDRNGSAAYAFVLFIDNPKPGEIRTTKRKPADIGRLIGARGGWNKSGHASGKQIKLPWSVFFEADV